MLNSCWSTKNQVALVGFALYIALVLGVVVTVARLDALYANAAETWDADASDEDVYEDQTGSESPAPDIPPELPPDGGGDGNPGGSSDVHERSSSHMAFVQLAAQLDYLSLETTTDLVSHVNYERWREDTRRAVEKSRLRRANSAAPISPSASSSSSDHPSSSQPTMPQRAPLAIKDAETGEILDDGQNEDERQRNPLKFGSHNVIGVPSLRRLLIRNVGSQAIRLESIAAASDSLHVSFFGRTSLEPGAETEARVLFLPPPPPQLLVAGGANAKRAMRRHRLRISTSAGSLELAVLGAADANPYRLPALAERGVRLPLNATVRRLLQLHNPHAHPIRLTEIYTSGGDVHVELGEAAHIPMNAAYWELRPFETRQVGNVRLVGGAEGGPRPAFVAIRFEHATGASGKQEKDKPGGGGGPSEQIIYSVPYEVVSSPGWFTTVDLLDFGLLRMGERSALMTITAYSSLSGAVDVETLYVIKGDAAGVHMEFASYPPINVPPPQRPGLSGRPVDLVHIYYDSAQAHNNNQHDQNGRSLHKLAEGRLRTLTGEIVAVSRGRNHNVTIPFVVRLYNGALRLAAADDTVFRSSPSAPDPQPTRSVRLQSSLPFPVAVFNVSIDDPAAARHFTARLAGARAVSILPGESATVLVLKMIRRPTVPPGERKQWTLTVHTNLTAFTLPIIAHDQKPRLQVDGQLAENNALDFGRVDQKGSVIRLTVQNPTPSICTLRGVQKSASAVNLKADRRRWINGNDVQIDADASLELEVRVAASVAMKDEALQAELERRPLKLTTHEYGALVDGGEVLLRAKTGKRELFAAAPGGRIDLGDALFPGSVTVRTIGITNRGNGSATMRRLGTLNHDPLVTFEHTQSSSAAATPKVEPGSTSTIGRFLVRPPSCDPAASSFGGQDDDDQDDEDETTDERTIGADGFAAGLTCYAGLPLGSRDGKWFVHGLDMPPNLAEIDAYLYRKLRAKYNRLRQSSRSNWNSTLLLDVGDQRALRIPVGGRWTWPRLFTRPVVHFPLTAVGNFTIINLTLANPTASPLVVQVIPLVIYPDAESLLALFDGDDNLPGPLTGKVETNETLMFTLRDTELFTLRKESPVPARREHLERVVGKNVPRFTLSMLMKPWERVQVRVGFMPIDLEPRSTLLLIRNNLTAIEPVILYAEGARLSLNFVANDKGQLAIPGAGRVNRQSPPLLFEITNDYLFDCNNPQRLTHKFSSTLTVRRTFLLQNTGDQHEEDRMQVPIHVVNMSISGAACENRGFRILNCHPIKVPPNETYLVDIAYTPDFLATTNEAELALYLHMNGSGFVFPLVAVLPEDMLLTCHTALPRPPFEPLLYYSCATALLFLFICVVACAYLEGDRAITQAIRAQFQIASAPFTPFDLNSSTVLDGVASSTQQASSPPSRSAHPPRPNLNSSSAGSTSTTSTRRLSPSRPSASRNQSVNGAPSPAPPPPAPRPPPKAAYVAPSIHPSPDAGPALKAFCQLANRVIWLVSLVWYRGLVVQQAIAERVSAARTTTATAANGGVHQDGQRTTRRRRRNPVAARAAHLREMEAKKDQPQAPATRPVQATQEEGSKVEAVQTAVQPSAVQKPPKSKSPKKKDNGREQQRQKAHRHNLAESDKKSEASSTVSTATTATNTKSAPKPRRVDEIQRPSRPTISQQRQQQQQQQQQSPPPPADDEQNDSNGYDDGEEDDPEWLDGTTDEFHVSSDQATRDFDALVSHSQLLFFGDERRQQHPSQPGDDDDGDDEVEDEEVDDDDALTNDLDDSVSVFTPYPPSSRRQHPPGPPSRQAAPPQPPPPIGFERRPIAQRLDGNDGEEEEEEEEDDELDNLIPAVPERAWPSFFEAAPAPDAALPSWLWPSGRTNEQQQQQHSLGPPPGFAPRPQHASPSSPQHADNTLFGSFDFDVWGRHAIDNPDSAWANVLQQPHSQSDKKGGSASRKSKRL